VIVKDGVEGTEEGEIVFVGGVVSMPCNNVERRVIPCGLKEVAAKLVDDLEGSLDVFKGGNRREKVPRIGKAIGTDGTKRRQLKVPVEDLANVPSHIALNLDRKEDSALDDADLLGFDLHAAKLGSDVENALLGNCNSRQRSSVTNDDLTF